MVLKLTNNLPKKTVATTFDDIECGTVFEYEEDIHIKVNERMALLFIKTPINSSVEDYWVLEGGFIGDEEITIIESELILKSRKG